MILNGSETDFGIVLIRLDFIPIRNFQIEVGIEQVADRGQVCILGISCNSRSTQRDGFYFVLFFLIPPLFSRPFIVFLFFFIFHFFSSDIAARSTTRFALHRVAVWGGGGGGMSRRWKKRRV